MFVIFVKFLFVEFFHKAIMMSGSDMSRFAYIDPFYRPREYAFELADRLDCPTDDSWETMKCMRDNNTRTWQNVLYHASKIVPHVSNWYAFCSSDWYW